MRDEHPGKAFLTAAEVRRMLRLSNRESFEAWLSDNPTFPKLVAVGKTAKGKPRLFYPKSKVLSFLELLGG